VDHYLNGNAQVDGNLSMLKGGNIKNNAAIGGNVTFDGGGNKISGTLQYAGTKTIPTWATLNTFVSSKAEQITNYTNVNLSSYSNNNPVNLSNSTLPVVSLPTNSQNARM